MTVKTEPFTVRLVAIGGLLHTKTSDIVDNICREHYGQDEHSILLSFSHEGVTQIAWPEPDFDDLRNALYDARETGMIPNVQTVTLPNGRLLFI